MKKLNTFKMLKHINISKIQREKTKTNFSHFLIYYTFISVNKQYFENLIKI